MSELFEDQLSQRLRAHPLPEEVPDLAQRSIRQGERTRRRRISAAVVVVVLLLAIPGITSAVLRTMSTDPPPVTNQTSPAVPVGPGSLVLDAGNRRPGPAPKIPYLLNEAVRLPDGTTIQLARGQIGTVTQFGSGAAWLTRSGGQLTLNVSTGPLPVTVADGSDVTGVEPGPDGSVMVRTTSGPLLWTKDNNLVRPSQRALRSMRVAATANALWVEATGGLTRVDMSDPSGPPTAPHQFAQWTTLVTADVRADRVVVTDKEGCHAVIDGSSTATVWRSCASEILAISPDGRLAAARSSTYRTLDILDLTSSRTVLQIDTDPTRIDLDTREVTVGDQMVFDDENRLYVLAGDQTVGSLMLAVEASGTCWITVARAASLGFVFPNLR